MSIYDLLLGLKIEFQFERGERHSKPHFHVWKNNKELLEIGFEDGEFEVLAGNLRELSSRERKALKDYVRRNHRKLKEGWNRYNG